MVKIAQLPEITSFNGTEIIPINSNINVTSKATLANIDNFVYPTTITKIRSMSDFPAPVGGEITLTTGVYEIDGVIITTDKFVLDPGSVVTIACTHVASAFVYLGTDKMFNGVGFAGLFAIRDGFISAPAGGFFDIEGPGSFFCYDTIYQDCASSNNIRLNVASLIFNGFFGFADGFYFTDKNDMTTRTQVFIQACALTDSLNNSVTLFNFSGDVEVVGLLSNSFVPAANETLFNFDESLRELPTLIICNGSNLDIRSGAALFAPNSLKQDYLSGFFSGNTNLSDSTTSIQIGFNNPSSPEVTTINTVGVREVINARWQSGSQERLLTQDLLIFDNPSNTITTVLVDGSTPFAHGLLDNDRILLKAGIGGSIPPELNETINYYVVSATTNTFQLSLTEGGPAIGFSTNGTGTNYYRHNSGINAASWIVYVGLEDVKITSNGSVTMRATTGSTPRVVEFSMVKLDTNFAETTDLDIFGVGDQATIDNSTTQGSSVHTSVSLSSGESIRLYVTNTSSDTNIEVLSGNISIAKV